jgi:hypothetical protein
MEENPVQQVDDFASSTQQNFFASRLKMGLIDVGCRQKILRSSLAKRVPISIWVNISAIVSYRRIGKVHLSIRRTTQSFPGKSSRR